MFKRLKAARILLGVYLLLATFNIIAVTAIIRTNSISIGPVSTPPVQLLSLLLLVIYAILNTDCLIEEYLDYKEKNKGL
ncbi:hypothetical protein [Foetidibacter luteolus]|uniref:hypothetical protein n=1 Tax=Foetidibacter luteolus TaxID=2608880 RepID=UPI00129BAE0E|nr:hypothetical protein [Foetidibacter luteolus]